MSVSLDVAAQLARALDGEDYDSARRLLAPDCIYETGGPVLHGPESIVRAYLENGEKARQRLDNVGYTSEATLLSSDEAAILFSDHITHNGMSHVYRCRQGCGSRRRA